MSHVDKSDTVDRITTLETTVSALSGAYVTTYNAGTNSPDLQVSPSGIEKGDKYEVSDAGTFFTTPVYPGDILEAKQDNPTLEAHWLIATGTGTDAVLATTTDVSTDSWVLDEDNMASDDDTKVPTQQSVKAYVDSAVVGGVTYKGSYDALNNIPDLDTTPSGVIQGDMYTVTSAGVFFTTNVELGDVLIAEIDSAAAEADWTIVNRNLENVTLNTDSTLVGNTWFLDDDTMGANDATKVPSQQSVKAYVDGLDANAVHTNGSGEINGLTVDGFPAQGDEFIFESQANSWAKRKCSFSNLQDQVFTGAVYPASQLTINNYPVVINAGLGMNEYLTLHGDVDPATNGVASKGNFYWDSTNNWPAFYAGVVKGWQYLLPAIDEDTMVSDSVDYVPTQQSVKAYVDSVAGTDADAIHDNVAAEINALTAVVGGMAATDVFILEDASAGTPFEKRKITFSNLQDDIFSGTVTGTTFTFNGTTLTFDGSTVVNLHGGEVDLDCPLDVHGVNTADLGTTISSTQSYLVWDIDEQHLVVCDSGGDWRYLGERLSNTVIVNQKGDFPAPSAGVITLAANTTYIVTGVIALGTDRIVLADQCDIQGTNPKYSALTYTGTGNMLTAGSNVDFAMSDIKLDAGASGTVFDLNGGGTEEAFLFDITIVNCAKVGDFASWYSLVWEQGEVFDGGTGITTSGTSHKLIFDLIEFVAWDINQTMIDIGTTTYDFCDFFRCEFEGGTTGQTGIDIAASSANINAGFEGRIEDCFFENTLTNAVLNADAGDLLWYYFGNGAGLQDSSYNAQGYNHTLTTTTIGVGDGDSGNPKLMNGSTNWVAEHEDHWTISTGGRITYNGEEPREFHARAVINGTVASGTGKNFNFYIAKNGTAITASKITREFSSGTNGTVTSAAIVDAVKNDYFELFVENTTDTNNWDNNIANFIIATST
jgi:hypothetical protein